MMLEEKPIRWRELIETLFRRRRILFVTTAIGVLLGITVAFLQHPVYRATARILLTADAMPGPRETAMSDRQVFTELTFLKSPALIRSVLEEYAGREESLDATGGILQQATDWLGSRLSDLSDRFTGDPPVGSLERKIRAAAERITAEPIDRSNVVQVAFVHPNPQWAATFVNELLDNHVERIADLAAQTQATSFFAGQRNLLEERWEKARQVLTDFREDHGTSLLAGNEEQLRSVVSGLEAERVTTETEVLQLRARVDFLAAEIKKYPETIAAESRVTENTSVTFLNSRILELEIDRADKLSRYTPNSSVIRDLDRQIDSAKNLLQTKELETLSETMTAINPAYQALEVDSVETRSELAAATVRLRALTTQIETYRQRLKELGASSGELQRLENEVANAREAHQSYLKQEEEARFSSALDESRIVNISVIEKAEVPTFAEPMTRRTTLLISTLAGLLIGLFLAYLRDFMDDSVKSSAEASRLAELTVVAQIPPG